MPPKAEPPASGRAGIKAESSSDDDSSDSENSEGSSSSSSSEEEIKRPVRASRRPAAVAKVKAVPLKKPSPAKPIAKKAAPPKNARQNARKAN
jgi:hypothetical protein